MDAFVVALQAHFEPHRNPEKAAALSRYMKNQFPFLGIQTPERKALLKHFLLAYGVPSPQQLPAIVRGLWQLHEREYTIVALDLLEKNIKHMNASFLPLMEEIITTKSWWDTVDYIAPRLVGTIFTISPEHIDEYVTKWMQSGNIWLQRTALLFQLKYKQKTDIQLLFSLIQELSHSKEFFIQKAIGWVLREYAKTDADAVRQFVQNHHLAPLSKREALKHIGIKNKASGQIV
ncbi:DNA alkylation repair protein [Ectobacillus antri]|uniref:DNA alkylation repair protein n=1 Tax=Ectobacillus antri TaxID=2486280 RepID=A0ABT6H7W0_9BACI|nr:DNA alkylation repair protein [Ectobacillus antri]MDG4658270.1 DNA alkylation repair protein [Ectobacillus antri]MDG5755349.1 DNA alkylation repair protein [Ectobacillus antri]